MYKYFAENLNEKIESNPVWILKKDIKSADGNGFFQKGTYITQIKVINSTDTRCVLALHSPDMSMSITGDDVEYKEIVIYPYEFDDCFEESKELSEKVLKIDKTFKFKFVSCFGLAFVFIIFAVFFEFVFDCENIGTIFFIMSMAMIVPAFIYGVKYCVATEDFLKIKDDFFRKYKEE